MFESLGLAGILLPLGVAIGWYIGTRNGPEGRGSGVDESRFVQGIAHLVDDDPDQAIAHFVRLIEVDEDTVETHLMLGRLFRKRGEVDRALRLHQNLIARPNLTAQHRTEARFELAQDYLKAGVLDRAEQLFRELIDQGQYLVPGLEALVVAYEQQREWQPALEAAQRLEAARGESQSQRIAQYLCEQAEAAIADGDLAGARKRAERALRKDSQCVRASLLLGRVLSEGGDPAGAVRAYRRLLEQDARYLAEILPKVEEAYRAQDDADGFLTFLADAEAVSLGPEAAIARSRLMQESGLDGTAHLVSALRARPSWSGAKLLLDQPLPVDEFRAVLTELCERQLANRPRYRCNHCGLQPSLLFWQCPSCRQWGSVAPVPDQIGAVGGAAAPN